MLLGLAVFSTFVNYQSILKDLCNDNNQRGRGSS
jgi:hypothetical protein